MYFADLEGPVFRPPSEARSFILRVAIGCSHNRCTYCNMYRSVAFRPCTTDEIMRQIDRAARYKQQIRRVFLADGDALVLPTERLLAMLAALRAAFPKLQRVAAYAGPKNLLGKSPEELAALREAGLKLVYYGLESGDEAVLRYVNKGVGAAEAVTAGQKAVAAGMKLSVMVILGLGGQLRTQQHAVDTAAAVNAIRPHMLSALTLMLYRGSELVDEYEAGRFALLSPAQIMGELHRLLAALELPAEHHCLFRSNHISNYLSFAGTLPRDKNRLMAEAATAQQALAGQTDWDPYNNVEA